MCEDWSCDKPWELEKELPAVWHDRWAALRQAREDAQKQKDKQVGKSSGGRVRLI